MGGFEIVEESVLPEPPIFDYLTWLKARSLNYYEPLFFDWFRFAGNLTWFTYCLSEETEGFRDIEPNDLKILQGLLNRCSRLMLAHMRLSHEQKFGETTAILDRCIFESAIKVRWLCKSGNEGDRFRRFKADGLKKDLKLKREIEENVRSRGSSLPIEDRMLSSIENYLRMSGLTEQQALDTLKQPDLKSMMLSLGIHADLPYITMQGMGSHHVHGTWSSLLIHYLEPDFESLSLELRDHDCIADQNTYAVTAIMVLLANRDYLDFVLEKTPKEVREEVIGLMENTIAEITELLSEAGATKDRIHAKSWSYIEFD